MCEPKRDTNLIFVKTAVSKGHLDMRRSALPVPVSPGAKSCHLIKSIGGVAQCHSHAVTPQCMCDGKHNNEEDILDLAPGLGMDRTMSSEITY